MTAAVEEIGAEVLAVAGDVRSEDDLAAAVAAVTERFGRLDGVVAGVGGAAPGPLAEIDLERFRRQLDLNLTSAFATVRAGVPAAARVEGRGSARLGHRDDERRRRCSAPTARPRPASST